MAQGGARHYAYRFVDARGTEASATVEAFSRAEAIGKIKARGHCAVELRDAAFVPAEASGRRLPGADLELLAGQIARLLAAAVPLDRALDMVAAAETGRAGAVAAAIRTRLRAGAGAAEACGGSPEAFDGPALALVRAGERSGDLAGAFAEIEKLLAKQNALTTKVRSAMIYPAVVLVTAVGAVLMILLHVIPQFESMVADNLAIMPFAARAVFGLSRAVQTAWPVLLAGLAVLGLVALRAARAGRIGSLALAAGRGLPMVGPVLDQVGPSRLARLLGTLLSRSVPLMDAFEIATTTVSQPSLARAMETARAGLQQGQTLRGALGTTRAFPPVMLQLLQVGEETGRIGPMLLHAADLLDERIDRALRRFLILLQPMILVVLGLVVGALLYGLFSAIFAINQAVV